MKIKKIVALVFLTLVGHASFSQRIADEILKMDSKIENLTQNTITGIIVLKEGNIVRGINPDTKTEIWHFDAGKEAGDIAALVALSKADTDNLFANKPILKIIKGTPYVEALVNYKTILINTIDGKVVYNSEEHKYTVFNSQFLYESNEYLVKAVEGDKIIASLINLNNGAVKWKTVQGEIKDMFTSMFTFKANTSNEAKVNSNTIYSLYFGKLSAIDRTNGDLKWVGPIEYTKVFPMQNNKNLVVVNNKGIVSSKQYLNVLDSETGKSIWKDAIKTKYIIYLEDWGTKILVAYHGGFNFYNLNDGSKIWKKDARGYGLKKVIPIDGDYLYAAENKMMLIDNNGQKKWKNFIEISDHKGDVINYLKKVGNKVLYLTDIYSNIVDYKAGKKIWTENLKFNIKRPLLNVYDKENNSFLIYNDEELFKFDIEQANKPTEFAKVNIKNEKELNAIELFSWGVALSGPSEILGANESGTVLYQNVYTQPVNDDGSPWGQALTTAGADSIGLEIYSGANTIAGPEWTMTIIDPATGKDITAAIEEKNEDQLRKATVSEALEKLSDKSKQRQQAMKQNRNFSYIFAVDDANGKKILVKVKKEDGTEQDKITFEDTYPIYKIDPVTQSIYYIYKNELRIFDTKK